MRPVPPICHLKSSASHRGRCLGWRAAGVILGLPLALFAQVARAGELPTLHARLATGPIVIDGKLDEAAWAQAESVTLTQQSPYPGGKQPYTTEVRMLISGDALVFGFRCVDPNPSAIQTHTLTRDGDMTGDDSLSIMLDSFGDRRTGYFFQINSAAARTDGLISGPGKLSAEWDGIWDASIARTAEGWSAEIRIPSQTLNFVGGNNLWGLELDRFIARDQTELRWASPLLDADFLDMSRAGYLEIGARLKQGHRFEIAPYLNGKMLRDFSLPRRHWLGASGGEITWRVTPQLAAVGTVNTDFAETEVDSRQVNITPFPLYYPEKRAFFLEGANQYVFGLGLEATFVPFFSRSVGLLDGYNIPLDGGVKLNGHVGRWSLGFLDVQTRTTFVPDKVVQDLGLPSARVKGTNLLASRVAYDLDKHLRLGATLTHGDPEALLSNLLAGADAVWHTSTFLGKRSLQFGGWAGTTQGNLPNGKRQAWGLRADYPNDLLNCSADLNQFGDGFYPLMGYIPRPATHQTNTLCSYRPRPSPTGHLRAIRQAAYDFGYDRVADTSGKLQSEEYSLTPVHLTMTSGDALTFMAFVRHETLANPFAVTPSVSYPIGSYDFQRFGAVLFTSPQRPVQFMNQTYFGGYYNGHMLHQANSVMWTPLHGKAELGLIADNYFGHTPQGNYVEKLWQFRGALSWNPNVSLSTFVQFDNISNSLSSNTRLRWTIKPGDDFFLIWDRSWLRDVGRPGVNLGPAAEGLTAKIRWTFRL